MHLAEAADLSKGRGPKQQAKTDAADARHLRELLQQERVPESWIPPTEVLARLIDGSKNRHWLNHDRQAAEPS